MHTIVLLSMGPLGLLESLEMQSRRGVSACEPRKPFACFDSTVRVEGVASHLAQIPVRARGENCIGTRIII